MNSDKDTDMGGGGGSVQAMCVWVCACMDVCVCEHKKVYERKIFSAQVAFKPTILNHAQSAQKSAWWASGI